MEILCHQPGGGWLCLSLCNTPGWLSVEPWLSVFPAFEEFVI